MTVSWAGLTVQDDSSTWCLRRVTWKPDPADPVSVHIVLGLSTWPCPQDNQITALKVQGYQRKEMEIASLKSEAQTGILLLLFYLIAQINCRPI